MGCGCGGKKRIYVHTAKDGTKQEVDSLVAAMNLVRAKGGSYQLVRR